MSIGRAVTVTTLGEVITLDPLCMLPITEPMPGAPLICDSIVFDIPSLYWTIAESSLSTVIISLPIVWPLFRRLWQFGPRSLFTSTDFARQNAGDRFYGPLVRKTNEAYDQNDSFKSVDSSVERSNDGKS